MLKLTSKHQRYWKERDIDWNTHYTSTADHPHRKIISWMLEKIPFTSLWEVGVGGGANLVRLAKDLEGKQLGGCDINAAAIEQCKTLFNNGLFHVESGDNMMMSDKSVDIVLTDMTLIYVDPLQIDNYLREFKRVARQYVVLVEFNHKSWWKRQLLRLGGYHAYDYQRRLEKLGYYDIRVQHIHKDLWGDTDHNTEFRTIITARV